VTVDVGAPGTQTDEAGAALGPSAPEVDLPERAGYRLERVLLGPPLTNCRLEHQRLSKVLAPAVPTWPPGSSSGPGSRRSPRWPCSSACCSPS
jgi:hypothetical protein